MREMVGGSSGKYLHFSPTIKLLKEQRSDYSRDVPRIPLIPVHSKSGNRGSVSRQLEDARCEIDDLGAKHAVVFASHECLLAGDLSGFRDYHALIDEVPDAIKTGVVKAPTSAHYFSGRFELEPWRDHGWSLVRPKARPSWRAVKGDDIAKATANFEAMANRPHGAIVDLLDWKELEDRGHFSWMSIWTPMALSHFASITIAGAGFYRSLPYLVAQILHPNDLTFTEVRLHRPRTGHPKLRLHYFVEAHQGATSYWGTTGGRQVLGPIRRFLRDVPDLGYWSGNEVIEQQFDSELSVDRFVLPKVAGLNRYTAAKSCAFIYSAQSLPSDEPLKLFKLAAPDIEQAREFEDLYQFVMRGSLRDPAFGGTFDAYVYSRAQAEEIGRRAQEDGIHDVELVRHPEVGVMDVPRARAPKAPLTPEEIEEKTEADKAKDAERHRAERKVKAEAAGRSGAPGRPRKSLPTIYEPSRRGDRRVVIRGGGDSDRSRLRVPFQPRRTTPGTPRH